MRLLAIVLAIVLVLVLWAAVRALVAWNAQRRLEAALWQAAHRSLPGGGVEVRLERAGEEPVPLARLDPRDPAFDDHLHEAMAEARARAAALNSERALQP